MYYLLFCLPMFYIYISISTSEWQITRHPQHQMVTFIEVNNYTDSPMDNDNLYKPVISN